MSETMERLARLETQMEQHSETLEKISATLDKLVEAMIANQGNRAGIEDNAARIDGLDDEMQDVKRYVQSRWYVLATLVSALVVITQLAIETLL